MRYGALVAVAILLLWLPHRVFGSFGDTLDPIAPVVLGTTTILFFALLGRFVSRSFDQPPVLGELLMGMILGNLAGVFDYQLIMVLREGPVIFDAIDLSFHAEHLKAAFGPQADMAAVEILKSESGAEILQVAHVVDVFARYGVLFLLFYIGLETSLEELREVGAESVRVAVTGVLMPFGLGLAALWLLMPENGANTNLFVAATLTATSVGISASVLQDLGRQQGHEAHVILGAAVIDDILGLVLLAIIASIVKTGSMAFNDAGLIVVRAGVFLAGAVILGPMFLRLYIAAAGRLNLVEAKLFVSIIFAMGMAWVADLFGLAPIIGAFTAGVILSDGYFRHWGRTERRRYRIRDLILPIETILVPFFFVLMGMQVKLEGFLDGGVIKLSAGLIVIAIVGKLLAGVVTSKGTRGWVVGIGMVPRGEVGLVFASMGKALGVVSTPLFSAIVLMVITTTLLSPVMLRYAYRNADPES